MEETFSAEKRNRRAIAIAFFFLALVSVSVTQKDIGITWDEIYLNDDAARIYVEWTNLAINDILSGDFTFVSRPVIDKYFEAISDGGRINWHPPFARILGGISWKLLTPFVGEMRAYRMPSAIFFSLEVMLIFLIISRFFGIRAGILSGFSFALIPRVFGHAHIFALDTPVSAMWFITIYSFIRGLDNKKWALATGFIFGLALSTKIHAALIPVALLTWFVLTKDSRIRNNTISAGLFSLPVFILSWPWLWYDTFSRMLGFEGDQIGDLSTNFKKTYYLGETLSSTMPWHYVPVMLSITIPPLILVAFFYGTAIIIKKNINIVKNNGVHTEEGWSIALLLLLNAVIMIAVASAPGIPKYDGVRLFLPAFAFIACVSGIGIDYFLTSFIKGNVWKTALILLYLSFPFFALTGIHPFELSYYNIFTGGIRGANKAGFETTYWGDAFNKKFLDVLEDKYAHKQILYGGLPLKSRQLVFYNENGMVGKRLLDNSLSTDDAFTFSQSYDYLLLNSRQGVFRKLEWFYYNFLTPGYTTTLDDVRLLSLYESPYLFAAKNLEKFGNYSPVSVSYISLPEDKIIKTRNIHTTALLDEEKLPEGTISIRISTILKTPERGKYEIYMLADGDTKFFIDDELIKPYERIHGAEVFGPEIEKGFHILKAEIKNPRNPGFVVCWKMPSGKRDFISPKYLFHLKK